MKEALKLALEALEEADEIEFWNKQKQAIIAIKEALAQPDNQGKIQTVDSLTERKAD
tara:strand:- start:448 stop:618 length:171 start_codon:yes stop_codon:yes gene_type:complete